MDFIDKWRKTFEARFEKVVEKCRENPNYELQEDEKFAIGFVSGVPYSMKADPNDNYILTMELDPCGITWDGEKFIFLVVTKIPE